jgi:hypothetical protein
MMDEDELEATARRLFAEGMHDPDELLTALRRLEGDISARPETLTFAWDGPVSLAEHGRRQAVINAGDFRLRLRGAK